MTSDASSPTSSVLITGAGRGIGRATALRLAAAGWDVYAGLRDMAAGKKLAEESERITPIELDVTDAAHVAALAEALPERLDAVVNNAAEGILGPVEPLALDDLRRQLDVNVVGQIAVTQAVLPRLRASRGRVLFMSSVTGRVSPPMEGAYNASKFALEALADSLRVELRPWGIRVVIIEPGPVDTETWHEVDPIMDAMEARMTPEHRELYAAHTKGLRTMLLGLKHRAMPADGVATTIERALVARRPRARYPVGSNARIMLAMRAVLPTRALDATMARFGGLR